jgi:hypothetical protein
MSSSQLNQPQIYADALLTPPVSCPSCSKSVQGFASVAIVQDNKTIWRLHPCGCKVDHHWASGLAAEMKRRENGGRPQTVQGLSASVRQEQINSLRRKLEARYVSCIGLAEMPSRRQAVERDIITLANDLRQVSLEAYTQLPGIVWSADSLKWAQGNKLHVPGANEPESGPPSITITASSIRRIMAVEPRFWGLAAAELPKLAESMCQMIGQAVASGSVQGLSEDARFILVRLRSPSNSQPVAAPHISSPVQPVEPPRRPTRMITRLNKKGTSAAI